MASKGELKAAAQNRRRELLERRSTEELLAGLKGEADPTGKKLFVDAGGRTLVRQILKDRGVATD